MWHIFLVRHIHRTGAAPGHIAWRPIVATQLIAGDKRIACLSILDSGADHCVFPLEFAKQLGFNPADIIPVMTEGVGSAGVPMYYWTITIDLGAAQVEVIAGFTEDMNGRGIGLLGQYGFFDRFKVPFDLPAGRFWVEVPDPPQPATIQFLGA